MVLLTQAGTCGEAKAAGEVCTGTTAYRGKDSTAISNSFAVDCCVAVGPPCSVAKKSGQKCPSYYQYDTSLDSTKIGTTFAADCCKVRIPFAIRLCGSTSLLEVSY